MEQISSVLNLRVDGVIIFSLSSMRDEDFRLMKEKYIKLIVKIMDCYE